VIIKRTLEAFYAEKRSFKYHWHGLLLDAIVQSYFFDNFNPTASFEYWTAIAVILK
jgi:hypothetical protein